MEPHADDVKAIEALIARQFGSLNWTPGRTGDWQTFAADYYPEASLFPAARPAQRQTVDGFVERMRGLAGTSLRSFHEGLLGTRVHIFGNVAVAIAGCEITENEDKVNRGVEMLLLIKDSASWRIVSQAWDTETPSNRLPTDLQLGAPAT